jgi:hypothetical protein
MAHVTVKFENPRTEVKWEYSMPDELAGHLIKILDAVSPMCHKSAPLTEE